MRRVHGPSSRFGNPRWIAVAVFVACAAQIASIAAFEFPPVQDYPNHLLRAHVHATLADVPIYASHLAADDGFRPNLLTDWYLGALAHWFPLRLAGKILLCTQVAAAGLAIWMYLVTFGGNVLGGLIAMHLAGSYFLLKGNLNFHVGVSLGLIYLALLWSPDGTFTRTRAALATVVSGALAAAPARRLQAVPRPASSACAGTPGRGTQPW